MVVIPVRDGIYWNVIEYILKVCAVLHYRLTFENELKNRNKVQIQREKFLRILTGNDMSKKRQMTEGMNMKVI